MGRFFLAQAGGIAFDAGGTVRRPVQPVGFRRRRLLAVLDFIVGQNAVGGVHVEAQRQAAVGGLGATVCLSAGFVILGARLVADISAAVGFPDALHAGFV